MTVPAGQLGMSADGSEIACLFDTHRPRNLWRAVRLYRVSCEVLGDAPNMVSVRIPCGMLSDTAVVSY